MRLILFRCRGSQNIKDQVDSYYCVIKKCVQLQPYDKS